MREDFTVFILTHGRADRVDTIKTLRKSGYTGPIWLVIDNEDEQRSEYEKLPVTGVYVFDKAEEMKRTDTEDNFANHKLVVYARNRIHEIAAELGFEYFLMLDDDYKTIDYRYIDGNSLRSKSIKDADKIFELYVDFLEVSGARTVCFSQAGDFIGGATNGNFKKQVLRKAMNSFFCKTDRPFKFTGSTNEDVNMYITLGMRGELCFTVAYIAVTQHMTQENKGGLTDIYLEDGTYVKSFYSVICQPSCAMVKMMGEKHRRIHHQIKWNNCCPKIINERYRKVMQED